MFSNRFSALSQQVDEQAVSSDSASESPNDGEQHFPGDKAMTSPLSLCDICDTIFAQQRKINTHYEHHASNDSMNVAAQHGCFICSLLLDKVTALCLQIQPPENLRSTRPRGLIYSIQFAEIPNYRLIFEYGHGTRLPITILTLTVHPRTELETCLTTRPLGKSTWSDESIQLARQWLQNCLESHNCHAFSSPMQHLPTRLIHTRSISGEYEVTLCEGASLAPHTPYLTLSHRWGEKPVVSLKTHNLEQLKDHIEFQDLPGAFRHAVIITRELGYEFLWIDSLCILQDSLEDWLKEGPRMGEIYRNAVCNIAATGFEDSQTGLFVSRKVDTLLPLKIDVCWSVFENHCLVEENWWETAVDDSPLCSRAWVLQERLLSPRILHFGACQLFWECENSFNEVYPTGLPTDIRLDNRNSMKEMWPFVFSDNTDLGYPSFWMDLVEDYSTKALTYPTDKLAAISGIAKEINRALGDQYLAGIWKGQLFHQLLWIICSPESSTRIQPYTAPTWSWASISGKLSYRLGFSCPWSSIGHEQSDFRETVLSTLLEADTSVIHDEQTGPVKDGSLRLKGPLREARRAWGTGNSDAHRKWLVGGKRRKIYFLPDTLLPGEPDEYVNSGQIHKHIFDLSGGTFQLRRHVAPCPRFGSVFLLPIRSVSYRGSFHTHGLVLTPTGSVQGQFRRTGVFLTINSTREESLLCLSSAINPLFYDAIAGADEYIVTIV